ncbi:GNAT family N-acetyltransferase [Pseudoxanthomonas mexicana]|uniref:GNAT family N-acetyltransferase n=1 Tax=Pseudoxanthomonas mexicana TaxID=128785 RepID=UPI00398B75BC
MTDDYQVRLDPLPDPDVLRESWQALEARSACSVFLRWPWIESWLAMIGDSRGDAWLVTVSLAARTVGLGLIVGRRTRNGLGTRGLWLHETGDPVLDNLTVEYNGLLSESGRESACLQAMIRHLARSGPRWSLLHLPGIPAHHLDMRQLQDEGLDLQCKESATPYVDLAALRKGGQSYLSGLSANNRSAIRRTARRIEQKFGALSLRLVDGAGARLEAFDRLCDLHQRHWSGRGGGAFADPRIVAFHRRLLADPRMQHQLQLLALMAGERPVGYVYGLIWGGATYFYQAGIDYDAHAGSGSPGLLMLSLAVQHACDAGQARYEFMAGDSRYKRALATQADRLVWLTLDRSGWLLRARRAWRRLKSRGGAAR